MVALVFVVVAAAGCASAVAPGSGDGASGGGDGAAPDEGTAGGCPSGFVVCDGRCTNLASSPNNCGGCGNRCNAANQVCRDAHCVPAELCNGSGCSGGATCCAERICCPSGTTCVEAIPDFMGCCPVGERCD
jgi:hypothetical protein